MPGFFVSNCSVNFDLRDYYKEKCVAQKMNFATKGITVKRQTLNKFMDDKIFDDNNDYLIVLEGYLLNKHDLLEKYKQDTLWLLLTTMYEKNGETFFREFRGCFSGTFYDKKKNRWLFFTNQIGDNPLFYFYDGNMFAVGSQIQYLLDFCDENKIKLSFNESCAYQLMTFGYVATNEIYAKEINRIGAGDYLVVQDGNLFKKTYHRFEKNLNRFQGKTEDEIIIELDKAFKKAVSLEWEKDNEYGLKHFADLSGGLDSRMNYWVAHELMNCHPLVLTYSKAGYLDETIAENIAHKWRDEIIFKALDDATFLYDIDENTSLLGGLSLYSGITGGKRLLENLNLHNYGIEHTGMVGDAILGSFYSTPSDGEQRRPTGMYSQKLIMRLSEKALNWYQNYFDYEIYLMYARGFHGACNSHLIRRNFTEVGSPFLNVDFMQLCYDIPVELRVGHRIYKRWIIKMHPDAANFKWEKTGAKITEGQFIGTVRKAIKRGPNKIKKILGKDELIKTGMNPLDYWLSENEKLREYIDSYEKKGYVYLPAGTSKQLEEDMKNLYAYGNTNEKTMVLTVLSSMKLYFGEKNGTHT